MSKFHIVLILLLMLSSVFGVKNISYGFVLPDEQKQFPTIKLSGASATYFGDGKQLLQIKVKPENWRTPTDEIAFHCATVAHVVHKAIPFAFNNPKSIQISKWDHPRILRDRGPNNEYLVLLGDNSNQAPYIAFGFGQELGHALIDNLNGSADPQLWFEETFCEALAVWALQQLALEWGRSKDQFMKFASEAFSSYAKSLHYNTQPPSEGYSQWFAKNRKYLTEKCNDRELNNILAIKLIEYANTDPTFFQSFLYLRKNYPAKVVDSIEWVLKTWRDNCPDHLKSGPEKVATLLGVTIQ